MTMNEYTLDSPEPLEVTANPHGAGPYGTLHIDRDGDLHVHVNGSVVCEHKAQAFPYGVSVTVTHTDIEAPSATFYLDRRIAKAVFEAMVDERMAEIEALRR